MENINFWISEFYKLKCNFYVNNEWIPNITILYILVIFYIISYNKSLTFLLSKGKDFMITSKKGSIFSRWVWKRSTRKRRLEQRKRNKTEQKIVTSEGFDFDFFKAGFCLNRIMHKTVKYRRKAMLLKKVNLILLKLSRVHYLLTKL